MKFEYSKQDELIENIGRRIVADELQPSILNPLRIQQMAFSNTVLEKLTYGTDMKISAATHKPFKSMGSICIEGDCLEFTDCKWLSRAIQFASNVEVYTTLNGKIKFVLTFHSLTNKIPKV
ncbi:MAG: hypothetical protein IKA16_01125 [Oscillospiraceae bacterium]|nr:hypothetical protein [Oscillospiraceae bacterium]